MFNINWSQPTWDLFVLIFFVAASFIFGLSLGKGRIITIMVALYMTMAVLAAAPFLKAPAEASIAINQVVAIKVTAFIAVFLGIFFLLSRTALISTIVGAEDQGSALQIIIFSFLLVGLLINTVVTYVPFFDINTMSPMAKLAFGSEYARFAWTIAPVLAMLLFRRKPEKQ